jgi:aminopeptidase-like protein
MSTDSNSEKSMYRFMETLWPLHRTLNSDDMERSIELCGEYIDHPGYKIHRYPAKSEVLGWWVPERYRVREAWLEIAGERVADFEDNPLHLLSYSLPQIISGRLGDIRDHLWSNRERPNAIPWEFKFYERSWGFCLRHADLERFEDDAPVRGVIDVEFTDEDLVLGEFYLPGETGRDMLFLTNICHPMQVNDSLTGLVVGLEMARRLSTSKRNRYGFRLLVVPETIGTIAWASNHAEELSRVDFSWFCEMVGHDNSFILQHSRQGRDSLIDRAFLTTLRQYQRHGIARTGPFRKVVASDEIVINGPGLDIPTPSLTRWPYEQYHTSDDNPSIVTHENLDEALEVFMDLWDALGSNYYPQRSFVGPVMLSRHGLWVDWRQDLALNLSTESIMLLLEGDKSVIDIAFELDLPVRTVRTYIDRLAAAGMVDKANSPWQIPAKQLIT